MAALFIAACSPQPETAVAKTGSDRDAHGCIGSAGYSWSKVRGACIRLWEEGTALTPVTETENPVLVGYVVLSDDGQNAEIFLPDMTGSVVLKQQPLPDQTEWTGADGQWQLFYSKKQGWSLLQNGAAIYQAPAQEGDN